MTKIFEKGGKHLKGTVSVGGAKNVILSIQAATLLASSGTILLHNVDPTTDIVAMNQLLNFMNLPAQYKDHSLHLPASTELTTTAPFSHVKTMDAAWLVMAALLARRGRAKLNLPDNFSLTGRSLSLYIKMLEAMGATISQANGQIIASADHLCGARLHLDFPSLGVTAGLMLAATLASGITVISNAAQDPEIVDLAKVLNKMGAQVHEAGTKIMRIQGVSYLHGCEYTVMPDRIVTGTYLLAGAITAGDVLVKGAIAKHNAALVAQLKKMGATVINQRDGIRIIGTNVVLTTNIKVSPYPGFPTELQPAMATLMMNAHGTSMITDPTLPNNFSYLKELEKFHANYQISNDTAAINGPSSLKGAEVTAYDVRTGIALVLAGLMADGMTQINDVSQLNRDYYELTPKLASLGADIKENDVDDQNPQQGND